MLNGGIAMIVLGGTPVMVFVRLMDMVFLFPALW